MMHNLDVYIIVVFYSFLLVSNSLYEVEPTDETPKPNNNDETGKFHGR